ncbi:M1 family aminopeptidase [Croceitalea sp. MTPC5]|uniref:M1 family aminopeptidase n=1 Tax=Croceitalea marina TaxID=1775166 RepID=A0ABW5N1W5_9FLAO|nr:M1 family aminopeptidase [Croceitalea sp. MTPC5]
MLLNLVRFEVLYQSRQRALLIFALLFFFFGFFIGGRGQAPAQVNFNSAYQITNYATIFSLGSVFIVMFFAISGVIRDKKHQMEALIFSTSVKKKHFFWSRFIGVFIFSILGFSLFLPGFFTGLSISGLDSTRIAPFHLQSYIWPLTVIIIPNLFICSTLIFSVSILSKSNLATYASAVLIYMLYFLIAFYSNSPILASSVSASPEAMAMAAMTDPFSGATFFEHTQFWTPYDKNHLTFSFSGFYLWNRILWIGLSCIVLAITYRLFSFRKTSKKTIGKQKITTEPLEITPYFKVVSQINTKGQWKAFWSLCEMDMRSVFKSLPFLVIILTLIVTSIYEVYARISEGGIYGDSLYPLTNVLIEIVMELVPILSLILIVFYSGELIWRARDRKMDSILYSTPTVNWVFFLSKLLTLVLVPMLLIASVIIVCIGFQLAKGSSHLDFEQYVSIFYYYGASMLVYCMLAVFVQSVVNNKFLGMGITGFVLLFLGSSLSFYIGIEHPMLRLGDMPIPMYSNMTGYSIQTSAFHTYTLYWTSFGIILSILSFKLWKRGTLRTSNFLESFRFKKWKQREIGGMFVSFIFFLGSGIVLFNEVNIENRYLNSDERMNYAEAYERKYKVYDSIPRLHYLDMKTEVDIYPNERKYSVSADYVLINKNEVPITHLFITERKSLSEITLENAEIIFRDTVFGTYLFKFTQPILPNETTGLRYNLTKQSSPFKVDKTIVKNGSYIRHDVFEPALGYRHSMELSNAYERQKRGLPKQEIELEGDSHLFSKEARLGSVTYETIVSTDNDQIALAAGNLIKDWEENDRHYYHYKFPSKNIPSLAYISGKYELRKSAFKDISIEHYYHPNHDMNHNTIDNSVKATLKYSVTNFGNYPFDYLRMAEIPSFHNFGGAAHPGLIGMVEDNLYLIDIRNTGTFDLVSKRTVHEVSHQWWGMILKAKNLAGSGFLIEGFAKYTEGVVLEKMYGKGALWQLNQASNDRYFEGRSYAVKKESPLYLTAGQGYLNYGKSGLVMLSIRDLIGEDKLNQVLRTLSQRYKQSQEFEVHTLEFLNELYKITPEKHHSLIDDWMKQIVRYDLSITSSSYEELDNGTFEIIMEVKAKRYKTLADGEEKEIAINEPIQIGLFKKHPKGLGKNDTPIYLEQHNLKDSSTILRIQVDVLPDVISVDPFLTRTDRIYSDNLRSLEK